MRCAYSTDQPQHQTTKAHHKLVGWPLSTSSSSCPPPPFVIPTWLCVCVFLVVTPQLKWEPKFYVQLVTHLFVMVALFFCFFSPLSHSFCLSLPLWGCLKREELEKKRTKEAITFAFFLSFFLLSPPSFLLFRFAIRYLYLVWLF